MKKLYFLSTLMLLMTVMLPQNVKAQTQESMIETHVTSFGRYDFSGKHFFILSNMAEVSSDDVEFKEYAKLISYAFQMRGGIEVSPQSEEAEVCVLLSYDIKDASYVRTVSEPVWGKTGVREVTATTNSLGTHYNYYYDYGVVDYKQSQQVVNKYNRYIDLFVYELSPNENDNQKMVWKAYAKSEGSGNNLFRVFPNMALKISQCIGYTEEDGWNRLETDSWIIRYFKQGVFIDSKRTYDPYIESEWKVTSLAMGKDDFSIWQVRKESDFTRVTFLIQWESDDDNLFMFFKNTYLKYKNQKYLWKDAFYIDQKYGSTVGDVKIGKRNYVKVKPNEPRDVWVCVDFEPLPDDATVIDLISQKNNKSSKDDLVWKGIHLRNW